MKTLVYILLVSMTFSVTAYGVEATLSRSLTQPTGWWYQTKMTPKQINDFARQNKARLVDIEVRGNNQYTTVFVKNSGKYKVPGWWWYVGDIAFIKKKLKENKARLIDLEFYKKSGNKSLFAAIMIRNSGNHRKSWWWSIGGTSGQLKKMISQNNARLIDLEVYQSGGKQRFAAIMVRNSGADAKGWWWFTNRSFAQVQTLLSQKKAKLVDLNRRSNGRFDVVMVKRDGKGWWWGAARTLTQVRETLAQNKARLFDLETYVQNGQRRFVFIAGDNANSLERRIRSFAAGQAAGARRGFYLRQIGGPTLAAVRANENFVPASSLKVLYHYAALQMVRNGQLNLTTNNRRLCGPNTTTNAPVMPGTGSCPFSNARCENGLRSVSLNTLLSRMMVNSNNRHTQSVRELVTQGRINTVATQLGMSRTLIRERIGCGVNVCRQNGVERPCNGSNGTRVDNGYRGNPLLGNQTTLRDLARVYQAAQSSSLGNQRDNFFDLMLNEGSGSWIRNLASAENANVGLSSSRLNSFLAGLDYVWKGGSYDNSNFSSYTRAGLVEVPTKSGGVKRFVFGVFTDRGNPSAPNNVGTIASELLRLEMRKAMLAFK